MGIDVGNITLCEEKERGKVDNHRSGKVGGRRSDERKDLRGKEVRELVRVVLPCAREKREGKLIITGMVEEVIQRRS